MKTGATSLYFQVKVPVDLSPVHRRAGLLPVEGRDAHLDVHRPPQGPQARRLGARASSTATAASTSPRRPPSRPASIPWLERGGIYAVPNLRGGGEYGEDWHKAGMLAQEAERLRRLLAAAAEYLEKENWTSPDAPGSPGRLERRPPRRRGDHAAARALPRRALRRAAARHGALPPLRLGQDLDPRVRLGGRRRRSSRRSTPTRPTTT